jgi:hypothetical protein
MQETARTRTELSGTSGLLNKFDMISGPDLRYKYKINLRTICSNI